MNRYIVTALYHTGDPATRTAYGCEIIATTAAAAKTQLLDYYTDLGWTILDLSTIYIGEYTGTGSLQDTYPGPMTGPEREHFATWEDQIANEVNPT